MNKTTQLKTAVLATVLGVMSPLAMIVPASAADVVWGGIGDQNHVDPYDQDRSDDFTNIANWIGGTTVPGVADNAVFSVDGLVQNVNVNSAVELAKIVFSGENTFTSSKSYTLSGSTITLNSGIDATMTGDGGDHAVETSVVLGADATFMTSGVSSLSVGGTGTVLDLAGNVLTVDASGGTVTLQGLIDGAGGIEVTEGRLNMLAAPGDNFGATVTVSGGEFVVSSNATDENVVIAGGALKGDTGTEGYLGTVTLNSGSIAPGYSPGCLNVTNLVLTGGSYDVELWGNEVCTEYDSTSVTGDIALGDGVAMIDIERLPAFAPEVGDTFAVMTYAETSEVTGYFENLEESGDTLEDDGVTYEINYDDDSAVTLTVLGVSDEVAEEADEETPDAPDTGLASLITNPFVTMSAAAAVLTSLGAVRFTDILNLRK